jgi:hypothetical protein
VVGHDIEGTMNATAEAPVTMIAVNGARTELIDRGRGRPILFLHRISASIRRRPCSPCWPRAAG